MSLIVPEFTESVVVRQADAEVVGRAPTTIRLRQWAGSATAGLRVTSGSELYGDYTPDYDSHTVRRIRAAGFVIVGKTSSPELGIVPVEEMRDPERARLRPPGAGPFAIEEATDKQRVVLRRKKGFWSVYLLVQRFMRH